MLLKKEDVAMNVTPIPLPDPAGRLPLPRVAALKPATNAFANDVAPLAPPPREAPQIGRHTEIVRWPRVFPGL